MVASLSLRYQDNWLLNLVMWRLVWISIENAEYSTDCPFMNIGNGCHSYGYGFTTTTTITYVDWHIQTNFVVISSLLPLLGGVLIRRRAHYLKPLWQSCRPNLESNYRHSHQRACQLRKWSNFHPTIARRNAAVLLPRRCPVSGSDNVGYRVGSRHPS